MYLQFVKLNFTIRNNNEFNNSISNKNNLIQTKY